jgi:hypothetical protein
MITPDVFDTSVKRKIVIKKKAGKDVKGERKKY